MKSLIERTVAAKPLAVPRGSDTIYFTPAAVAVFFAVVHAGYAPERALQCSDDLHPLILTRTALNRKDCAENARGVAHPLGS
jgi:hypothetical protein